MTEYQFKIPAGVWLDIQADTAEEAVVLLNSQMHLFDEPLPAPGLIQRVQVDNRKPVTIENLVAVYNPESPI
jgi:hypothetical protein